MSLKYLRRLHACMKVRCESQDDEQIATEARECAERVKRFDGAA